ncbi:hypothetical protein P7K49_013070 [Saguinus oedipus]|uniref:Uncharacterized protein n=1 Tax=Saguinus oedipus TaxID=9490 RepID=A0ABQ9VFF3_SAGOE|nr:hypothetical protein P7K49_013070 [Saguinus oedipus]
MGGQPESQSQLGPPGVLALGRARQKQDNTCPTNGGVFGEENPIFPRSFHTFTFATWESRSRVPPKAQKRVCGDAEEWGEGHQPSWGHEQQLGEGVLELSVKADFHHKEEGRCR